MDRTKRQRNSPQSKSSQVIKKKNYIENLSNEIFYEIFDYLDGYDIYQAFSNLNIRFENLFLHSSFLMRTKISSKTKLNSHYKRFIHSNKHRIISFDFDDQTVLNQFILLFPIDLLFLNLQSIVLNQISTSQLLILLFYFKSLPHLSLLNICLDYCNDDLAHIYQIIFRLPLRYLTFDILKHEPSNSILPMATNKQYSSIEYFTISHYYTLKELTHILSYTPRLLHLYCSDFLESDNDNINIKLSNLVHLCIDIYELDFNKIEPFLLKFCSKLKLFNVEILCSDEDYLDSHRWERFISHHMPLINKFIFCYRHVITENFRINSFINRFTSPFWIQRKWFFQISLDKNELIYSIEPYKNFQEIPVIQLTVRDTCNEKLFIDSIWNMIQITYLDIRCDQISTCMFIKILNNLPNLTVIRISNLPSREQLYQCYYDANILNKFITINKITKVILRNISTNEQIDLIIHLFPRIQYLSLQYIHDHDIQPIVRYTLLEIKESGICHPMNICIFGLDAEYDKVQKLKQMIDSEDLLQDYTIDRQLNRFYLQWK